MSSLIVKLTDACTLACSYCYVRRATRLSPPRTMTGDTVERVLQGYLDLAVRGKGAGETGEGARFIWHGGEPTLPGLDFYRGLVKRQKKMFAGRRVVNSIVSNGVGLSSDLLRFFRDENFELALSVDGPARMHDVHRRFPGGGGSFACVDKSMDELQRLGMRFATLSVVTEELSGHAAQFYAFVRQRGIASAGLLPRFDGVRGTWLSGEALLRFYRDLFDLWIRDVETDLRLREIGTMVARVFGRATRLCEFNRCADNHFAVDTAGNLFPCDLLVGNKAFCLGNVVGETLEDVLEAPTTIRLQKSLQALPDECLQCEFLELCKGGCAYRRLVGGSAEGMGKDVYCKFRKDFFSYLLDFFRSREVAERSSGNTWRRPTWPGGK